MEVKINHRAAKSLPSISVADVRLHANGPAESLSARVVVSIMGSDRGVLESFASLRLNVEEARKIAAMLMAQADIAEALPEK